MFDPEQVVRRLYDAVNVRRRGVPRMTHGHAQNDLDALLSAFPDLQVSIEDLVAGADRVVVRLAYGGTHCGPYAGIGPTARRVRIDGVSIHRVVGDRIVEGWSLIDSLSLVSQLAPEASPAHLPTVRNSNTSSTLEEEELG